MSAFKSLVIDVFSNGCDTSKVSGKGKNINCYVKESYPHFLVSDGHHYMAAYFTKGAIDAFKSKGNTNITDLKSRVISISDWGLEVVRVNSQDVFNSYAGFEVRLIVRGFST